MIIPLVLAVAAAKTDVIRHMTYSFGISVQTTDTRHTSGIGPGSPISGQSVHSGSQSDEGTIVADVVGLRPDTGIVVRVQEQRHVLAAVPAAECIVWGVGTVVCQPGAEVTTEERALVRFLGRNFVNASTIDGHGRWAYSTHTSNYQESSTYEMSQPADDPLTISFRRVTTSAGAEGFNATTDGRLVYSAALSAPLSVDEETLLRTHLIDGDIVQGGYEEVRTDIHIRLTFDSLGATRQGTDSHAATIKPQ